MQAVCVCRASYGSMLHRWTRIPSSHIRRRHTLTNTHAFVHTLTHTDTHRQTHVNYDAGDVLIDDKHTFQTMGTSSWRLWTPPPAELLPRVWPYRNMTAMLIASLDNYAKSPDFKFQHLEKFWHTYILSCNVTVLITSLLWMLEG